MKICAFVTLACTLAFCAGSIICVIYSVSPDTVWYKYTTLGVDTEETWDTVTENDGDPMAELYKIVWGLTISGAGVGLLGTCMCTIMLFRVCCSKKSGNPVMKAIAITLSSLSLLTCIIGSLYFLRHPYYYDKYVLCDLVGDTTSACSDFSGQTEVAGVVTSEWGPEKGWYASLIGAGCTMLNALAIIVAPTK
ncbi:hypothetical protein Pelo_9384 [Pelomyxa schiedti]|nr:hypothetical protein Pelo_9384 [Pelomyxa schiedti]